MTPPRLSPPVFVDANSLISLAVVDRVDLLQAAFEGACVWSEAVHDEVVRHQQIDSRAARVYAAGLGVPLAVDGLAGAIAVEALRFKLSGRSTGNADLGEAQSIHLAERAGGGALLVTDDIAAADFARSHGLNVLRTYEVLRRCYEMELLGCPQAYELLLTMKSEGRGLRVPPNHFLVC